MRGKSNQKIELSSKAFDWLGGNVVFKKKITQKNVINNNVSWCGLEWKGETVPLSYFIFTFIWWIIRWAKNEEEEEDEDGGGKEH